MKPQEFTFHPARTYTTAGEARKAVNQLGDHFPKHIHFVIVKTEDGRFAPLFWGPGVYQAAFTLASHGFTVVS